MTERDHRSHPSGRPVHHSHVVDLPRYRIPDDEPLTPRLRMRERAPAIGFTVGRLCADDEQDDE